MAKKQKAKKEAKPKIQTSQPVTKYMALGECLEKFPETMEVFAEYGLHCIGCSIAMHETIEQGAQVHGLDVNELVNALNKKVKEHRKEV